MKIDSNSLVSMAEANQNFSKVTRMVEENGMAVILKNNRPRYVVVDFEKYEQMCSNKAPFYEDCVEPWEDSVLENNMERRQEAEQILDMFPIIEEKLLKQALSVGVAEDKITVSLLQRRLRIGYGRATRIIDCLEELGCISSAGEGGVRKILKTELE